MVFKQTPLLLASVTVLLLSACSAPTKKTTTSAAPKPTPAQTAQAEEKTPEVVVRQQPKPQISTAPRVNHNSFSRKLSSAATERTRHRVRYDGRYMNISYPWGDVPQNMGVCTDVVIRSYRKLGVDLQQQVHKDMSGDFFAYPNLTKWNLTAPDTNIDHRRVFNLKTFFKRHGYSYPVTYKPEHYKPGDIVTWFLAPGQEHIGIVVDAKSKQDPKRHMIVHNIAQGPKMEDVLFRMPITGHYRYYGQMRYVKPPIFAANAPKPAQKPVSLPGIGVIPPELLR